MFFKEHYYGKPPVYNGGDPLVVESHSPSQAATAHLLRQVVEHLVGHGDPLLIGCEAALERAHVLSGAADVGFHAAQRLAVVLPVARHLLEDQRVLVGFPLQGIDPHVAEGKPKTVAL